MRRLPTLALVLAMLSACGSAAKLEFPAGSTLDQFSEYTPLASEEAFGNAVPTVGQTREVAQTLTVGVTGTLVGFLVRMGTDGASPLTVRVLPTALGVPDPNDANALAEWSYPAGYPPLPGSTWFVEIPGGVPVAAGQQIALSVSYPAGRGGWVQSGQDDYAGGGIFERDPTVDLTWTSCCAGDLLFASYVVP